MATSSNGKLAGAEQAPEGVPINTWSESNVLAWLLGMGPPVNAYAATFAKNDIDGSTLASMSESEMADIGVDSFRVRRQIYNAVQQLQGRTNAPAPRTPVTFAPHMPQSDYPANTAPPQSSFFGNSFGAPPASSAPPPPPPPLGSSDDSAPSGGLAAMLAGARLRNKGGAEAQAAHGSALTSF